MSGETVFIDTVALLAACHKRDALHERTRDVIRTLARERARFVTSQWVLAEFLGRACTPSLRPAAIKDVQRVLASPSTEVVAATSQSWSEAFELYQSRPDKSWSLVDCSSILVCRARGIERVLTQDHHFAQAGLNVLLS